MSIFLSYRRADSQEIVGRMYDRLITHFPIDRVFRDLDSLPIGKPFPQTLDEAVAKANVALIVIGVSWVSITDSKGRRRLEDPSDFVRLEVEKALGAGFPVVPVLVSHATMPIQSDLPESLRPIVFRHGVAVRPDPDFHRDMDGLIGKLARLLEMPGVVESPAGVRSVAARRVWEALCDIRQFIGHELPTSVMMGGVIDGAEWKPIHRGWRILQEEQIALPAAVFASTASALTDVLQPGLNGFLDCLRAATAGRADPEYDAQVWVRRANDQLRRVQEDFAGRMDELVTMLRHDGR